MKMWKEICNSLNKEALRAIFDARKETKVTSDTSVNGLR